MLKKYVLTGAIAALCASVAVGAQSTPSAPQQDPSQSQPSATQSEGQTVTLTGCVYREADVPGRTPNVAERAGVLEDYILADASPKEESSTAQSAGTPGATGTSGLSSHKMFKLEQIADEKLSDVVGKRVEVTGRIDAEAGDRSTGMAGSPSAQPDRSAGPDRIELPEFEVSSIREIEGTCPPKPEAKH